MCDVASTWVAGDASSPMKNSEHQGRRQGQKGELEGIRKSQILSALSDAPVARRQLSRTRILALVSARRCKPEHGKLPSSASNAWFDKYRFVFNLES